MTILEPAALLASFALAVGRGGSTVAPSGDAGPGAAVSASQACDGDAGITGTCQVAGAQTCGQ